MSMRSTSRRAAALIASAAITSTVVADSATASPPHEPATARPAVNMTNLLIAAQLDQYRPGNRRTRGAVKSVRRGQQQLRRRGIRVAIDGNCGAQTRAGYAAWQRRLGYSGLNANGIPGETSLKRVPRPRFRAVPAVPPGARPVLGG